MDCMAPCDPRERKREKRRQAILAAAHDLFLEKGYEATTLHDIVGRSGGSLATLYEMFENKPGLLRALIQARCSAISETVDRAVSEHKPHREALREIAEHMFDQILDPKSVGLSRVVVAQSAAQPDLGRLLYEAGPATGQAKVAEYFAQQADAGSLSIDDPMEAAQMLFQMMFGHLHNRLLFNLPMNLTSEEKAKHLDRSLDAFLRIYERPPAQA